MDRRKELLWNTVIIGIGSIFSKIISFLLIPLFTIWLTPYEYGDYDLLFSYVSLIAPIITLQMEQSILRFTLENKSMGSQYFKVSFILVILNSFLMILILVLGINFKYKYSFIFCTISFSLFNIVNEYLRGKNKLKLYSLLNIFLGILTIILSYMFVKLLDLGVDGLLSAFGFSYLLITIFVIISQDLIKALVFSPFDKVIFWQLLLYALPLLPNAISWWITSVSDRTLIRIFLGSNQNGIYAVSTKIPTLIAVFYSIFNLAWQQSAISSVKDKMNVRNSFYNSTFENLFVFLFSSGIGIVVLTPWIYAMLLSKEYFEGIYLTPILILGIIFLNLSQYFGGILLANMDTKINGITTVVGAILNLVINITLISYLGLFAAAISTLLSYVVLFFLRLFRLKEVFNIKKILKDSIYWTIIFSASSYFIFSYTNFFTRIFFLLVFCIAYIYTNRKFINGILNLMKGKSNESCNH